MRILESNELTTEFHEIQITIDAPNHYAEMIEIHRESINGPGFVKVTSVKMFGPHAGSKQSNNTNLKGRLP